MKLHKKYTNISYDRHNIVIFLIGLKNDFELGGDFYD